MSKNRAEIIPYTDFIEKNKKHMAGPCLWKWKDIHPQLMESMKSSSGPSSAVSLAHKDMENGGISSNLNALVQVLKPGADGEPHRHSNAALFFVVKGEGYSIVDGEKFEWEEGDLVLAPAWSDHGHWNTSKTEEAILLTIQDVPQVTDMGIFFWEEPVGEAPRHIAKKNRSE